MHKWAIFQRDWSQRRFFWYSKTSLQVKHQSLDCIWNIKDTKEIIILLIKVEPIGNYHRWTILFIRNRLLWSSLSLLGSRRSSVDRRFMFIQEFKTSNNKAATDFTIVGQTRIYGYVFSRKIKWFHFGHQPSEGSCTITSRYRKYWWYETSCYSRKIGVLKLCLLYVRLKIVHPL